MIWIDALLVSKRRHLDDGRTELSKEDLTSCSITHMLTRKHAHSQYSASIQLTKGRCSCVLANGALPYRSSVQPTSQVLIASIADTSACLGSTRVAPVEYIARKIDSGRQARNNGHIRGRAVVSSMLHNMKILLGKAKLAVVSVEQGLIDYNTLSTDVA
jgi:hypothetical protein